MYHLHEYLDNLLSFSIPQSSTFSVNIGRLREGKLIGREVGTFFGDIATMTPSPFDPLLGMGTSFSRCFQPLHRCFPTDATASIFLTGSVFVGEVTQVKVLHQSPR